MFLPFFVLGYCLMALNHSSLDVDKHKNKVIACIFYNCLVSPVSIHSPPRERARRYRDLGVVAMGNQMFVPQYGDSGTATSPTDTAAQVIATPFVKNKSCISLCLLLYVCI